MHSRMMVQGFCAPCRAIPSVFSYLKLQSLCYRCLYGSHLFRVQGSSLTSISQCKPFLHVYFNCPSSSNFPSIAPISSFVHNSATLRSSPAFSEIIMSAGVGTFYADEGVSWRSLGLLQDVVDALQRSQLLHPSAVQAASIPVILAGGDVVMAAETGSGKTQAYLAPIFSKLLAMKQKDIEQTGSQNPVRRRMQRFALVLCPNAMLCEQVMHMANALCDNSGTPLLKVSVVFGGQGWPISPPDIVVATPAALLNHLFAYDPKRKRRNAFVRDVKYVVYDEADMLLSGGFENQVMRLFNMFRLEEKQLSRSQSGANVTEVVDCRPWTDFEPTEPNAADDVVPDTEDKEKSSDANTEDEESELSDDDNGDEKSRTRQNRHRDWLRSRKVYRRSKQYIFAAATLPENGRKTPGAVLKRILPDAKWVNGLFLHRRNPKLQEKWVEVDGTTQVEVLLNAVSDSANASDESLPRKTLVFTNNVESADAICKILKRAHIECSCYHRAVPSEERMSALKAFQDKGGVLVCTDAAARGLDIRNINHVIQAEFAKSAIDFLHRVGRTARAGQSGAVTSLYTKADRALVEAVRQAEAAGLSVEGAFSRKRSFRNKIKKSELASDLVE